jgi:hypothetical protein
VRTPARTLTLALGLGFAAASAGAGPAAAGAVAGGAAPAARSETMTHWSCDRTARASVTVTWQSRTQARVRWRVTDERRDGRSAVLRIVGLQHSAKGPVARRNLFGGNGTVVTTGHGRSGDVTWRPALRTLDEIEVWVWNGVGGRRASCGLNVVKRLNDHRWSPTRTAPLSYRRSKALRDRIVAEAMRQYRGGNRESGDNCSRFSDPFYAPNVCHPWCADFAWWVWMTAGVRDVRAYNSSYTDDFADEWRVAFKPLGGRHLPARGDVIVWSHRTDGVNGHVGVVVATRGWKVKVVNGNWGDRVTHTAWIDPFTSRQDSGRKRVVGFASPA